MYLWLYIIQYTLCTCILVVGHSRRWVFCTGTDVKKTKLLLHIAVNAYKILNLINR